METKEQVQKGIKIDLRLEDFLQNKSRVYKSGMGSKSSHNIAELAQRYGDGPPDFYPETFALMKDTAQAVKKSYADVCSNPKQENKTISAEQMESLKHFLKDLGVHQVGFTKVEPNYIFKNRSILYNQAIVITMEMDATVMAGAPSKDAGHEVHYTYNKLGHISNKLAALLRDMGFGAQAGAALGGDVDYKHLAEDAGLGAIGKSWLVNFSRLRAATTHSSGFYEHRESARFKRKPSSLDQGFL